MDEERIQTFIEAMSGSVSDRIRELEQEALEAGVPIIRTQTRSLIQFLVTLKKPQRILEVGAGIGYSGSVILESAGSGAYLTTIELDHARAKRARQVLGERASVLEGDAGNILQALTGEYDFIFMDAAKGQYIHFLPEGMRLLSAGGVLLSDNIFKEGEILESRFAVKRRNRTIHKRMREYIYALTHDDCLSTVLLQEGDGAAVSVKRAREQDFGNPAPED